MDYENPGVWFKLIFNGAQRKRGPAAFALLIPRFALYTLFRTLPKSMLSANPTVTSPVADWADILEVISGSWRFRHKGIGNGR